MPYIGKGKVMIWVKLFVFYLQYQENKEKSTNIQDSLFIKKYQQDYLLWKW